MRGISWLAEELFPSKKGYHRRLSDFVQSKLCDNINTHLRLPEQWQGWSVFWRHQVRIWGAEPVSITTVFRSVRKIAKKKKKKKVSINCVMSVRPHGTTRVPINGFSWHLSIFFLNFVEKIRVSLKSEKGGYFIWRPTYNFHISFLPRMRNVSNKICKENHNIKFIFIF